jgi:hypothetical protein
MVAKVESLGVAEVEQAIRDLLHLRKGAEEAQNWNALQSCLIYNRSSLRLSSYHLLLENEQPVYLYVSHMLRREQKHGNGGFISHREGRWSERASITREYVVTSDR